MDVREKLVEIMEDLGCNDEYCKDCEFCNDIDGCVHRQKEIIADRLIANGVTVQENVKMSDEILKKLKNAPITIYKSEPSIVTVQEWIPVTERLPDYFTSVLVWCPGNKCIYAAYRNARQEWYTFDDTIAGHVVVNMVTHWMPLPNPPKGE